MTAYISRISGVGFLALQIEPTRWVIATNPLPGQSKAYPVSDVFRGDATVARQVLREWGALYERSRPRAGEMVRAS